MGRRPIWGTAGVLGLAWLGAACSDSTTGPGDLQVAVSAGPSQVRQGDVATFGAEVRDASGSLATFAVDWSVEPASAGFIEPDGSFVGYEPGSARIVAEAGGSRDTRDITITPRGVSTGSFSVVGHGAVDERYTSDLWVYGGVAYTGSWGVRQGPAGLQQGNRLYAWDISNPGLPILTDSVSVDAGTVNDIKIRDDGAIAVLTHEGSADVQNGITILDLADPLHPAVITRVTDTMHPGVHNVWVDGAHVYAVVDGSSPASGLRVIDVADPAQPVVVSSFYGGDPQLTFGQFLHDVYVRDGLAFLSHWDAGLIILDVGNGMAGGSPAGPVEVGRVQTSGGDTHNAWYWPATGIVFVGEEDFNTPGILHVVDATELTAPREVATFRVSGSTPHNVWLDEDAEILYVAWYTRGIFAIDVSGRLLGELDRQDRVVASLTYDGAGACQGGGTCTWAPQLHQGLVWVSDLNSGLWSLRLGF